eukprot:Stramenopile-MAST_4_protein_4869
MACLEGQFKVVIECTEGANKDEVFWIVWQNNANVATGQGGDSSEACLGAGQVVVGGRDIPNGDSWDGAKLSIVGTDGTSYLSSWSGPPYGKTEELTFFDLCPPGIFGGSCSESCSGGKFGNAVTFNASQSVACPYTNSTCPVGYYCAGFGGVASSCPAGKFGNKTGLTTCYDCNTGDYSYLGSVDSRNCTRCPKGSACPGGVKSLCPAGKFGNKTGLTACKDCQSGLTARLRGSMECTLCPKGSYCPNASSVLLCPAGKYWNRTSTCHDCPVGSIALYAGLSHCTACSRGVYCQNATTRLLCPAGNYSDSYGASNSVSDCGNKKCPSGRYGFSGASRCRACPLGEYRDTGTECISCPTKCLGKRKAEFSSQQIVSTQTSYVYDVIAADLDGDGDMDLASASFEDITAPYNGGILAWYENLDGKGKFGPQEIVSTASYVRSVCAADVDGDGDLDLISGGMGIVWHENLGGKGSFGLPKVVSVYGVDHDNWGVVAADLDKDGD